MIARALNMPIELKDNNYYTKVFKRVNYKLSNNTFWVVITDRIDVVYAKNKINLLWSIGLGTVCEKTSQDNDVTDHTGAVYAKNEIEFHDW